MIQVCSSSTDSEYATTGDVMQLLFGATTTAMVATTGEINYLGTLVRRASVWAEMRLGYPLGLQTYSESVPAYGGRHLVLARTPIVSVLRLFDSTTTCEATAYCSTDYVIDDAEAGFLSRNGGWAWSQGEQFGSDFSLGLTGSRVPGFETRPWLVEYVAGYIPIGGLSTASENWSTAGPNGATTTGTTLPEDIRQAVAIKAAEYQGNPMGIRSRRVGDLAVEYASEGSGRADAMLAPYRRLG